MKTAPNMKMNSKEGQPQNEDYFKMKITSKMKTTSKMMTLSKIKMT